MLSTNLILDSNTIFVYLLVTIKTNNHMNNANTGSVGLFFEDR